MTDEYHFVWMVEYHVPGVHLLHLDFVMPLHHAPSHIWSSDVVKDPKPRNLRPRKLIPEQNPKPNIHTPKPRKPPKVLNLYIKYLKNTIKINNKNLEKFFFKIYHIFFFPSTFKSQKNNANIFVEFFFKKKSQKITCN